MPPPRAQGSIDFVSPDRHGRVALSALVLSLTAAVAATAASTVEATGDLDQDVLAAATVLISADPVDPMEAGWGSGTIIDADGLILTNAHVAAMTASGLTVLYPEMHYEEPASSDQLYIYTVDADGDQATPAYQAEVVAADGYLDLAVLRIVADIDGSSIEPDELDLPVVPIGRAQDLRPLDELIVTGFPGIAETFAVRFSRGEIHNFSDDPRVGPDAWIHTDAKIAEGNSGGMAVDPSGRLVAIPTMTMSDGPAGAIDYNMRPVELALPLIEAARTGRPYDGSRYLTPPTGGEFARVQAWATEATEECVAGSPDAAFPSGTWELFPQVRFAGMSAGVPVLVELVELSSDAEPEVQDFVALEWDGEWGSSACLPFELGFDRSVTGGDYRPFKDGEYGVRVWFSIGLLDTTEISEDARLTAATIGPMAATTTSATVASSAVSVVDMDTDRDDHALQARPDPSEEPSTDEVFPTRQVVVATNYIESGFPIESGMVELRELQLDDSNAGAYTNVTEVVDLVPAIDILWLQPITPNMLLLPPGGPASDTHQPLEVIDHGMSRKGNALSYAVVLRNPNEGRWFAERMPVRIAAVDRKGRVVATTREMATLLPGQTGAVVGDIDGARGAASIQVTVADAEGSWAEHDLVMAGLDVRAVKSSRDGPRPITRGRLDTWYGDWQEGVQVMAVYRDGQGRIIGGDSTYLRVVPGGETTPFRILGSGRVPAKAIKSTEVFYEL